jgi:hypothetical protein
MLLKSGGLKVTRDGLAITVSDCHPVDLIHHLKGVLSYSSVDAVELASTVANKGTEKFDRFLSDDLLCADYVSRFLDIDCALQALRDVLEK